MVVLATGAVANLFGQNGKLAAYVATGQQLGWGKGLGQAIVYAYGEGGPAVSVVGLDREHWLADPCEVGLEHCNQLGTTQDNSPMVIGAHPSAALRLVVVKWAAGPLP
jgi:hypothetical protein